MQFVLLAQNRLNLYHRQQMSLVRTAVWADSKEFKKLMSETGDDG